VLPRSEVRSVKSHWIVFSLISLYLVWGSTYLAIRIGLDSYPPFLLAAIRYVLAGGVLFLFLRFQRFAIPSKKEWLNSTLVGGLLLVGGNGGVTLAEKWIPTGLTALIIGTVPLWAALFSSWFGRKPSRVEWIGLGVGFLGVAALSFKGNLWSAPLGASIALVAAASWGLGAVLTQQLTLPRGLMSSAAQMLTGGGLLLLLSFVFGEHVPRNPSEGSWWALVYLTVFGSLVGYCIFMFLLSRVSSSLATSYAYVNPLVAAFLGWHYNGETITAPMMLAGFAILLSVALITIQRGTTVKIEQEKAFSENEPISSSCEDQDSNCEPCSSK